ncbi:thioesterase family protein [Amycolatopsis sp. FDAARGOS 1241]|uniref:thioesterase family protein n=1 Tax=Amycolatopsis sp. FDAARGOS 1241 TaxID=2778070 RepID=UPI00194F16B8|nr:thioesterase family protein [Amycolatopsis sp. FDAARGOS 1241]QRP43467.1 thioesterase family protein [Amycolatopsis sp. FDAARGOS 1241]
MSTTTFAAVSAVKRRSPNGFDADISPQWTIGGKPNGGYLLALVGRAAVADREHADVLAASAHYLRSPDPGPAEVEVETLRTGRAASQVRGRLRQDGKTCVEALFTVGTLVPGAAHWQDGLPAAPLAADATFRVPSTTPVGVPVAIMDEIDVRFDAESARVFTAGPSGHGELRGTLTLPGGEPFAPVSLLFAVDAFPPATFDIAPTGWVPTLELTVYVRARPAPGPLRVLHRAHLITDSRADESCHVWDSAGTLVAQATQLAGIRLG